MRFRDALKLSLKYHSLAVIPTLLGLAIIAGGLYFGAIRPVLPTIQGASLSMDLLFTVIGAINPVIVVVGIVLGYFTRRVGRTTLLMRTQGQAAEAALAEHELADAAVDTSTQTYDDSFEVGSAETTEAVGDGGDYDEFGYDGDDGSAR